MSRLVIATHNPGKLREMQALLAPLAIDVSGLHAWPPFEPPAETEASFVGNARLKALATTMELGLPALADDSGLVVDVLDGEPGIYSARYGGPDLDDPGRCAYLLAQLAARGVDASPARFVCALVLARPDGAVMTYERAWEGTVRGPLRGAQGFGYDPLFEPAGAGGLTSAELDPATKNAQSHRGQALAALTAWLAGHPEWLASAD
ncbi:MAG TPA: non-canonical purine NTP pyrophosphatase [Armatimonadetes bacterium]|nr:non-canonical purine NTP pyrophosphatase [Armatimonadota bacterium]